MRVRRWRDVGAVRPRGRLAGLQADVRGERPARLRPWGRLLLALGVLALASGCDRGAGDAAALYPPSTNVGRATVAPLRPPSPVHVPTNALLSVVETSLSPATVWRSTADRVECFAGLEALGLGGPSFLAYSSPTGIAVARPGQRFQGGEMRENWLLVGFAGAAGWVDWDSPWGVFLQRRPEWVRLGSNGVSLEFTGEAGHFALMPLYGYYKPPQQGREFLTGQGLKEKVMHTWEWPTVVARDPLTRLRYWSGATRLLPVHVRDEVVVDARAEEVVLRQGLSWLEIPDEWGTRPIKVAPVSPTLGLAIRKGERFPVRFSKPPMDYELPTPYGPYFGIAGVDSYEMRFPVLKYVHETEAPVVPIPADAPPVVQEALERLRAVARAKFPDAGPYRHDHGGLGNFCWAVMGDQWYAKALPYYDEVTRSNAVVSLGRYFREEVLVPERFVEREFPRGSGRRYLILEGPGIGSWGVLGDAGKFSANLLQTVWAYAHYSGDHALVRERWPLIRGLFTTAAQIRWVGFGRDEIAELGDEAAPPLAFARLAYLAGDLDAYRYACGVFARELVHLHVKQRGAAWFREQQPWHSMEPIDEEVFLTNLWGDLAGWQMDGPRFPAQTGERQYRNRWVRFQDLDVARFYREHLGPDVARELVSLAGTWDPARRGTDDSHILPSLVRLQSFLMNTAPTNLAAMARPAEFTGPPSGVIASCLSVIRASTVPRQVRVIRAPSEGAAVLGVERDVAGPDVALVQRVSVGGAEGRGGWPSITWWGWKTPSGAPWSFGEVRAGAGGAPGRVVVQDANWTTRVRAWE